MKKILSKSFLLISLLSLLTACGQSLSFSDACSYIRNNYGNGQLKKAYVTTDVSTTNVSGTFLISYSEGSIKETYYKSFTPITTIELKMYIGEKGSYTVYNGALSAEYNRNLATVLEEDYKQFMPKGVEITASGSGEKSFIETNDLGYVIAYSGYLDVNFSYTLNNTKVVNSVCYKYSYRYYFQ